MFEVGQLLSSSALLFKVGRLLSSSALMFEVGRLLSSSALMVGWSWGATGVLGFWGVRGLLSSTKGEYPEGGYQP